MAVTLRDVSSKSGFSVTTVSRALGGFDDVKEQTRQHIVKVANELGYHPNQIARQLQNQRTNTIGMIIPAGDQGFSDDFFSELMMGAGHSASHYGYDLLLSAQVSPQGEMEAYRRLVGGRRVDGLVLGRTRRDDTRIEYLRDKNFPYVVSGRSVPNTVSDFPFIDADSQSGIKRIVEHFLQMGHQHIALLLPPKELAYTEFRHQGYRDSLKEVGISYRDDYVIYGNLKRSGGYSATQHLLENYPSITAIVACNDLMAMGSMSAIQERGLKVAEDIAVSGFDDIPAAEYALLPLTTMRQPIYEIGQRLVEILIHLINDEPLEESQVLLQPELIIRDSCGFNLRH